MSVVFYDTETTGSRLAFDQIVQFAAILTDGDLNEIGRFDVRSRISPHLVPSPGAMRVTGLTIARLTDPALPSHYEMIRAVRARLASWSPALFIGYNSLRFDEHLLRQGFYQTLHPAYLTNTGGNSRSDALRMIQAAAVFAPGAISIPVNADRKPVFRLGDVARANGVALANPHDAMDDTETVLELCRLIRDRAPEVWSSFMRFSQKAAVVDYAAAETVFCLTDHYADGPASWLVTDIGVNGGNNSEHYVYDLSVDPDALALLGDEQLRHRMQQAPRPVRRLRCNAAPILAAAEDAPDIAIAKLLGQDELDRRAALVGAGMPLRQRLIAACEAAREVRPPSAHFEEQIYNGFPSQTDQQRMEIFHQIPWEKRGDLVRQVDDPRAREFGWRLIHAERPEILDGAMRAERDRGIARRIAVAEDVPWLTLSAAIGEAQALLADAATEGETALLRDSLSFFERSLEEARLLA